MPLTKEVVQDKIEVLEDGTLQVREATRFKDGDVVIAESYHRRIVTPLDNVTNETGLAKEIADKVHTPARKAAAQARRNNQ